MLSVSNTDFQDISSNKSEVDMYKQTWHYTELVNCASRYTMLEVHPVLELMEDEHAKKERLLST